MFIFCLFYFVSSRKFFCLNKLVSMRELLLFVYLWLYLNKRELKNPNIRALQQLYFLSGVFRVRNKSSLIFFEWKRFQLRFLLLVCVKWRVFSNQELILSSIVLVTLKQWLGLRNKLDYTHTNVHAKIQPHQPSVFNRHSSSNINYYKYLRFVCVVCGSNKESTS